ncbi:hypothetical protein B0H66DRAFT_603356 [Apodospora peruviana]|uniref:Uncharacterized protein n=1 Tax=Apodospora peruviana TaxID=516989 RepID=A0AAE0I5G5_9PEZI|nr:hypothetical protein B0H66DRAFT_603356 [Apodospora peruviana]
MQRTWGQWRRRIFILTTKGATAGAILMEWNVQAKTQGSAVLWDVRVCIGGAHGTGLTEKECPSSQNDPTAQCQAASLMMHLTKGASSYFENMCHKADTRLMNIWFDKFKLMENRCKGWDANLNMERRNMSEFMDSNDGNGCALIILTPTEASRKPRQNPCQPKEYTPLSYMKRRDRWSETDNIQNLGKDEFLFSQWMLTPKGADVVFGTPLDRNALNNVNQLLYVFGVNAMVPQAFPTVIMFDYLGIMYQADYGSWDPRDPSLRTLVIGLNLYMASQNCYHFFTLADTAAAAGRPKQWNGVIFANGTRFGRASPPDFSPMYPPLKPGIKFMKGTVVQPLGGATAMDF